MLNDVHLFYPKRSISLIETRIP